MSITITPEGAAALRTTLVLSREFVRHAYSHGPADIHAGELLEMIETAIGITHQKAPGSAFDLGRAHIAKGGLLDACPYGPGELASEWYRGTAAGLQDIIVNLCKVPAAAPIVQDSNAEADAYQAGRCAHGSGAELDDPPFTGGLAKAWRRGWEDERQALEAAAYPEAIPATVPEPQGGPYALGAEAAERFDSLCRSSNGPVPSPINPFPYDSPSAQLWLKGFRESLRC